MNKIINYTFTSRRSSFVSISSRWAFKLEQVGNESSPHSRLWNSFFSRIMCDSVLILKIKNRYSKITTKPNKRMCGRRTERDRWRQRQIERHRQTERDRDKERDKDKQIDRQIETDRWRQTDTHTQTHIYYVCVFLTLNSGLSGLKGMSTCFKQQ